MQTITRARRTPVPLVSYSSLPIPPLMVAPFSRTLSIKSKSAHHLFHHAKLRSTNFTHLYFASFVYPIHYFYVVQISPTRRILAFIGKRIYFIFYCNTIVDDPKTLTKSFNRFGLLRAAVFTHPISPSFQ